MGSRARWGIVVTATLAAAAMFNACAKDGDGPNTGPGSITPTPGGSSGTASSGSGSSGGTASSGGTGSSGSSGGQPTEDATLSDDVSTGDDGGDGGDAGDDAGDASDAALPPTCASGQTCVDAIPSGWSGYVQLVVGGADAGTVVCPAPYTVSQATGISNPTGAAAECSSCNCLAGDAGPIQCSVGINTANYGCLAGGPVTTAVQDSCIAAAMVNGSASTPAVASAAGTCAPSSPLPPPISPPAVACALAGDGGAPDAGGAPGPSCGAGQACATSIAASGAGAPDGICIYQSGVFDCPGHFSDQHIVGTTLDDTRGCSCGCNNPLCPTDGYITGYASNNCTGAVALTIDAGAPCKFNLAPDIHGAETFIYHPSHGTFKGTCTSVDAGPSGGVTIDSTGATTYCCVP